MTRYAKGGTYDISDETDRKLAMVAASKGQSKRAFVRTAIQNELNRSGGGRNRPAGAGSARRPVTRQSEPQGAGQNQNGQGQNGQGRSSPGAGKARLF